MTQGTTVTVFKMKLTQWREIRPACRSGRAGCASDMGAEYGELLECGKHLGFQQRWEFNVHRAQVKLVQDGHHGESCEERGPDFWSSSSDLDREVANMWHSKS